MKKALLSLLLAALLAVPAYATGTATASQTRHFLAGIGNKATDDTFTLRFTVIAK